MIYVNSSPMARNRKRKQRMAAAKAQAPTPSREQEQEQARGIVRTGTLDGAMGVLRQIDDSTQAFARDHLLRLPNDGSRLDQDAPFEWTYAKL